MKTTPWLVVGAGAIGLFWACKLKELGNKVHIVYRSEKPEKQITFESLINSDGEQCIESRLFKVKSFLSEELIKDYDKVLFCTKSFDLVSAFEQVSNHITENANIACLCNGIGAQEALQKKLLESQTLWAGTTSEGALKVTPNHVKHTGLGDTFFGQWLENSSPKSFPIPSLSCPNIHERLVEKLAVNATINPITSIFSIHNGDLLEDQYSALINATLSELAEVFKHPDFLYSKQSTKLTLDNLINRIKTVARLTRLNRSSMNEDIRLKRQTENDHISGFIVKNSPISVPIQSMLYEAIANPELVEETKKKLLSIT